MRSRCRAEITGPQMVPGFVGIAGLQPGHGARRRLDGLVVARPRHHQAGGDRAALAGVHRRGERGHRAGAGQIGVVEHQERRLAAEFEEHLLQRGGAVGHHRAAGVGRSGERHHVDARILRQQRTDAVVAGGDDVDDAGGEVGVLGDQLAQHRCAPRGVGSGLEHHRVARRQRGTELGEVDLVREVPRRDRADDADGLAGDRAVASSCPSAPRCRDRWSTGRTRRCRRRSSDPRPGPRAGPPTSASAARRPRRSSAPAVPRRGRASPAAAGGCTAPAARRWSTSRCRRTRGAPRRSPRPCRRRSRRPRRRAPPRWPG